MQVDVWSSPSNLGQEPTEPMVTTELDQAPPLTKQLLAETAAHLMKKVTATPAIESAWLSALAHMESLAAAQIRTNISAFTPASEREAIEIHASDEDRHAALILEMRPFAQLPDGRHEELKRRLCYIAEQFVVGYFGNPLLVTAKNKHVSYAHGALTIEQFPFQVYVAYLKATNLPAVKSQLPDVIRDEQSHLALGRRLLLLLPEAERLSIEGLMAIEEEMCVSMMRRMDAVLTEFLREASQVGADKTSSEGKKTSSLEEAVSTAHAVTVAWTFTLGFAEELAAGHMQKVYSLQGLEQPSFMAGHVADEMRHAKLLRRTVLLDRRRLLSQDESYAELEKSFMRGIRLYQMRLFSALMKRFSNPDAVYLYGALALEARVLKHYRDLSLATDHIGLSHVLNLVLKDEHAHTRQASNAISEAGLSMDEFREVARVERASWDEMSEKALAMIGSYRSERLGARVS